MAWPTSAGLPDTLAQPPENIQPDGVAPGDLGPSRPPTFDWIDIRIPGRSYDDLRLDPNYQETRDTYTGPRAANCFDAWSHRMGVFALMAQGAGSDSLLHHYARAVNLSAWYFYSTFAPRDQRAVALAAAGFPDTLDQEQFEDLVAIHRATCADTLCSDCVHPVQRTTRTAPEYP
jgi:hypothetical protein